MNLMSLINLWLVDDYCSITVTNHELSRLIRFISWFIIHSCKRFCKYILFSTSYMYPNIWCVGCKILESKQGLGNERRLELPITSNLFFRGKGLKKRQDTVSGENLGWEPPGGQSIRQSPRSSTIEKRHYGIILRSQIYLLSTVHTSSLRGRQA